MADMNTIIHDMEGQPEIGYSFKDPNFRADSGNQRTFDRLAAK